LTINELVEIFLHVLSLWSVFDIDLFQNSNKDCLESLEVPVLVNDLVDDSGLEYLVDFVSEKIHKVMHIVDSLCIFHVFAAPLGKQLLSHQENKVLHVGVQSELNALLGELQAHLDFVKHWPEH
jgi:hypothetical protein